jgi:hypothetical protein
MEQSIVVGLSEMLSSGTWPLYLSSVACLWGNLGFFLFLLLLLVVGSSCMQGVSLL